MVRLSAVLTTALLACVGFIGAACADTQYTFTTFAGSAGVVATGSDGTGSAAQFSAPRGIAVDSVGNLYVADSSNHSIRKLTAAGVVTTLAGTAGTAGTVDSTPARFNEPFCVAVDSAGTVYVADTNNNAIRKISTAGVVTTLAGGSGMGSTDGTGSAAKFSEPHGIAVDTSGNVFVADYMNHTIRKVTPAGVVTTFAGSAGNSGFINGQGSAARFSAVQGIALDRNGNLYVVEAGNRAIRKITASGLVTTFADGSDGQFGSPRGVTVDSSGNLYVTDYSANVIKRVTAAGVISTYAGTAPTSGSSDGSLSSALFNTPSDVAVDSANNVYVADTTNNNVRKIAADGTVTTLAGLAGRSSSVDGQGGAARFEDPYAVATDSLGNSYVADATDHTLRKITADGTVTTFAGRAGSFGSSDGAGSVARFKTPRGIATDSSGNVYVADTGNKTIRKITAAGTVSTLAGTAGLGGSLDATGAAARFSGPNGVAVDGSGNVYVIDSESATLRKITPAGVVTTLAGSPGVNGATNGSGAAASFRVPYDVAVDASGNIYVSDHGNNLIRKVTAAGVVTTLAGSGAEGSTDGIGVAASFKYPNGISVDGSGNVYVADTDNQLIRKITQAGEVTKVAGTGGVGSADGVGTAASFHNPMDTALDASGNLLVVDRANNTLRKGSPQTLLTATSLSLVAGWNLIGNGGTTALNVADTALFGDPAKVASVWKWVAASGKWAIYLPSLSGQGLSDYASSRGYNVMSSIDGGEGFWVNVISPYAVTLPAAPALLATTLQAGLPSGWSLVAIGETKNAADFDVTSLWAWHSGSSAWYFFAPTLNASGGLAAHILSRGYLDFAGTGKRLGQGVGFWVKKP